MLHTKQVQPGSGRAGVLHLAQRFRQHCDELRLRQRFAFGLLFQRRGHALKIFHHVFIWACKPARQRAVHYVPVEQHHEEHRQEAEPQRARHQFGANSRTHAVIAPLYPEFHDDARQHEAERHHEQENQQGDAEKNERLFRVFRAELAEVKRTLPHHERG